MKLKLKEQPIEWLKFTAVIGTMVGMIWTLGWWKEIHGFDWWHGWIPGAIATGLCAVFPAWFRGFYRIGTTIFFYIGQFMGILLLTLFFLLIMTPLGFFLKLMGNDLLKFKRNKTSQTYWQEPRKTGGHEKMF
ncbi:MAG: hypothetical protein HOH33_04925 [Verrucomicrobia bacterium]|jgi:hypothetical protein|nr:hypothetical protein [Verrucomicrobiota bacterium]